MRRIYFGGRFPELNVNEPEESMKGDFRVHILGDVRRLLYSPRDGSLEVYLSDKVSYIGPYYFYGEDFSAKKVVIVEKGMIHKCTAN